MFAYITKGVDEITVMIRDKANIKELIHAYESTLDCDHDDSWDYPEIVESYDEIAKRIGMDIDDLMWSHI